MGRRGKRRCRSKGRSNETELTPLVKTHDSGYYTSIAEDQDPVQDQSDLWSYTSTPEDQDPDQSDEAGWCTGSIEKLRFIVLGGDDALMDKACATILRKKGKRNPFHFGKSEPMNAHVCGRQVSVLKTPFRWLEHLKSYLFFSRGVNAIRNEIESNELMMFPGPHAFLLVHRDVKNSGREYYLLKALREVFGKEVLDYCMVLFMDRAIHKDPIKNTCLKMCENRHCILQNTDMSVNEMFKRVKKMTENKDNNFFTPQLEFFKKASNYFQVEYKEKEDKLTKALNDSTHREDQLKHENEKLQREVELLKHKEKQLQKNLIGTKDCEEKEDKLRKALSDSTQREDQLKHENEKLQREVELLKHKEIQLQKNLTGTKEDCEKKEDKLRKALNDSTQREDQLKHENEELQREVELLKHKEKQLERDVQSRELHQTTADTPSAVSGNRDSSLDECEGGIRDDLQASKLLRNQKPVRRNSLELNQPYMS